MLFSLRVRMMEVLLPAKLGGHNKLFGGVSMLELSVFMVQQQKTNNGHLTGSFSLVLGWLIDPWRFRSRWRRPNNAMYGACFFKNVLIVNENKCEPRTFKKLACFCCCSHLRISVAARGSWQETVCMRHSNVFFPSFFLHLYCTME